MQEKAIFIPFGAVLALLALSWYMLAMPLALDAAQGNSVPSPSSAMVLDAG